MAGSVPNQPPNLNLGGRTPDGTGTAQAYDDQGYPIPNQADIAAFQKYAPNLAGKRPPDGSAYDPSLPPPEPYDSKKWPNYEKWKAENQTRTYNQQAKEAYRKKHESEKKAPTAAPAQPFASAGIDLTKQGKGENFDDQALEHYSKEGIPTVSNESQVTLDRFRQMVPQDLSPYYNYASALTSAKIDNAMAARGSYGSSNATGQIGAAEMALRAKEADANAKYGLDRFELEGNAAGAADASSARANGIEFSWVKGLSDLAHRAQDAGQDRNQLLFDNNWKVAQAKAGNFTDSTDKAIEGVGAATDAANDVALGTANDKVSGATADANVAASHSASVNDAFNQAGTNYWNRQTTEETKRHNREMEDIARGSSSN